MSGVSLPPFELSLNKSFFQDKLRQPITASRRSAPLLSTEQISLLLSLLAIGVYQKAGAQDTDADLIITAQISSPSLRPSPTAISSTASLIRRI